MYNDGVFSIHFSLAGFPSVATASQEPFEITYSPEAVSDITVEGWDVTGDVTTDATIPSFEVNFTPLTLTLNFTPLTRTLNPYTLNPNPQPSTPKLTPSTLNPQP